MSDTHTMASPSFRESQENYDFHLGIIKNLLSNKSFEEIPHEDREEILYHMVSLVAPYYPQYGLVYKVARAKSVDKAGFKPVFNKAKTVTSLCGTAYVSVWLHYDTELGFTISVMDLERLTGMRIETAYNGPFFWHFIKNGKDIPLHR